MYKKQKIYKKNSSVTNVECNTSPKVPTVTTPIRRGRLSISNVQEHNDPGSEWVVLSEWHASANHSLSDSSGNTSSPNNSSSPNGNLQAVQSQLENISQTSFTQSMVQMSNKSKSNVTNATYNANQQMSQISQVPLTQYVSNNARVVANVTSSKVVSNVKTVENTRKMAEYKPASPPSPPSHMNTQYVEAQVHASNGSTNTSNTYPTQSYGSSPVLGSWSSCYEETQV